MGGSAEVAEHVPIDKLTVRVRRLREAAVLPAYQTAGAAGLDLTACPEDGQVRTIPPLGRALVLTGLAFAIPAGYEGQIRPRSGLALAHGITVLNSPGTVDCDYRGELKVLLVNLGSEPFDVVPGERIAQIVLAPVTQARLCEVTALDETVRGGGGYGHTGRGSGPGG